MTLDRLRVVGLAGLLLASTSSSLPAAVSCAGIPAWSATTTYQAGAQVTYSGSLYKALVSTTNVQPNYCAACGWWQLVDVCGTNVTCTTIPGVPTGLSSPSQTTTSINLSWSAVSTPANCTVSYNVYRSGSLVASGLSGTSTTVSGLTANTTYSFTVAAQDAAGTSAQSAALSVKTSANTTCTTAPAVPTGLAASGVTASSVNLAWNAVTPPANCSVTYNVYRGGTQVASGLTSTSTTVSGLAASTAYSFTVSALDAAGSSAQSAAVSVTTSGGTNACSGVADYSPTKVYWKDDQAVYNSQLWKAKWWTQGETPSTGGSGVWAFVSNCTTVVCSAAPAVPSGLSYANLTSTSLTLNWSAVTAPAGCTVSYRVYRNGTQIATPTTNSAAITGLTADTTYSFTVAAVDSVGASAQSAALSVKTPAIVNCTAAPSVPSGLASTGKTSSSVSLSWNASTAGAGCTITYNVYVNGSSTPSVTVPTTTATISGLAASTAYTFAVASVDSAGTSAKSGSISVTTNAGGTTNLPKRIMSGYWHTWGGGAGFIKLRDVNSNWDVINVSFAEPVTPGSTDGRMKFAVTGDASYTDADFKADIKTLQANGKKIVLSIGGYEGYFSLTSTAAVNTWVTAIKGFVNAYGFDGIDIDLEQSSVALNSGADPDFRNPVSPKVVNMISAIRQVCDAYGSNFILSWAPETFYMQLGYQYYAGINPYVDARAGCYIPMIHALRDKTTYVQAQLYNSGAILAPDGGYYSMGNAESIVAMCKMLLTGFNVNNNASYFFPALRADQVVIAVPASSSAAGSGQVSNATLQQAFGTLNSAYPGMRGIMAWSINWDNFQNGNTFASSNRAYLNTLP